MSGPGSPAAYFLFLPPIPLSLQPQSLFIKIYGVYVVFVCDIRAKVQKLTIFTRFPPKISFYFVNKDAFLLPKFYNAIYLVH